jgi:tRNA pseudouridine38-40 synthase
LKYDGRNYHGWQRQLNDISIQEVIEDKIQIMTREPVRLTASGRTDAGVHALEQVCNFFTLTNIPPDSMKNGLNSLLPDDIFIIDAEYAPNDFHSRYSAKSKIYEYRIRNVPEPDIFLRDYTWHIRKNLNLEYIQTCLSVLVGRHDFSAFKSTGSSNKNPVREMMRAELICPGAGSLSLVFKADGFLRHMVRNIVGTVIEVGLGKISCDEFKTILESRDRQSAGIKAPPQGLFLVRINY